eukprot:jgi/Hompol1/2483/HPOL_000772-RA
MNATGSGITGPTIAGYTIRMNSRLHGVHQSLWMWLPTELQLDILQRAGPLTAFLNSIKYMDSASHSPSQSALPIAAEPASSCSHSSTSTSTGIEASSGSSIDASSTITGSSMISSIDSDGSGRRRKRESATSIDTAGSGSNSATDRSRGTSIAHTCNRKISSNSSTAQQQQQQQHYIRIWRDAFELDWNGDLSRLPDVTLTVADLQLVHSRRMYAALARRFPSLVDSGLLLHIPLHMAWQDLIMAWPSTASNSELQFPWVTTPAARLTRLQRQLFDEMVSDAVRNGYQALLTMLLAPELVPVSLLHARRSTAENGAPSTSTALANLASAASSGSRRLRPHHSDSSSSDDDFTATPISNCEHSHPRSGSIRISDPATNAHTPSLMASSSWNSIDGWAISHHPFISSIQEEDLVLEQLPEAQLGPVISQSEQQQQQQQRQQQFNEPIKLSDFHGLTFESSIDARFDTANVQQLQHQDQIDDDDDDDEYLDDDDDINWTYSIIDIAAANGDLATIQLLHEHGSRGCSTEAMDKAAEHGHYEVVEFLQKHYSTNIPGVPSGGGCTLWAMTAAAKNGHLKIVRFLHEHRREGCTTRAMDSAAKHGHLDVVEFLHLNRTEGCSTAAMDGAAENGYLEVV